MRPLVTVFALCFALMPVSARAGDLRVGVASEVITPAAGAPLAGYYSPRFADGVDDDLHAKATVLELDGTKVAFVACDLLTLPRSTVETSRELITKTAGIPGDHVLISATHTHTGPLLLAGSTRDPNDGEAFDKATAYGTSLPELIAAAVRKADAKLAPANLTAAVGRAEKLSFNRRFVMKDGAVGWNAGKLNPKIEKPAGPVDPDVPIVYVESADGKHTPIATHVNFAMHLDTVGSTRISADYAAPLAAALARVRGPDMLTVFSTGAAGDINHIDVSTARKQEGLEEAKRIGDALAEAVTKAYADLKSVDASSLKTRSVTVSLPLAEIKPGDVEEARQVILKPSKSRMSLDRVRAFKVLDVAARNGKPIDVEVQVITVGDDLAFVSMPGEAFVELGLEIKKRSPFKQTIIIELANGAIGYLPTKRAYADGNYEPISARTAPGCGEMLVEAAVELLNTLHAR